MRPYVIGSGRPATPEAKATRDAAVLAHLAKSGSHYETARAFGIDRGLVSTIKRNADARCPSKAGDKA